MKPIGFYHCKTINILPIYLCLVISKDLETDSNNLLNVRLYIKHIFHIPIYEPVCRGYNTATGRNWSNI